MLLEIVLLFLFVIVLPQKKWQLSIFDMRKKTFEILSPLFCAPLVQFTQGKKKIKKLQNVN